MSDYLFDPKAPPDDGDREVEELERQLGRFKLREVAPLPRDVPWFGRGLLQRRPFQLAAAALVLLAAGTAWWMVGRDDFRDDFRSVNRGRGGENSALVDVVLHDTEGEVRIDSTSPRADNETGETGLSPGDRVVCDSGARATLRVGGIGWLELEEKTRVRVAEGHGDADREGAFRLDLERGTVEASIFAAPRVFALGTPSAIAVDLGCRYRTTVDDDGHTTLAVTTGRVSFESEGRKVYVPRGASCRAWPGFGPGTPSWEDASAELRAAVDQLDEARTCNHCYDPAATRGVLDQVLATKERRDSLTLWHLFDLPDPAQRGLVFDKLNALVRAPPEVTREKCVARDEDALASWRDELESDW